MSEFDESSSEVTTVTVPLQEVSAAQHLIRRPGDVLRRPSVYAYLIALAAFIILLKVGTSYSLFLWSTVVVYAIAAIGQDWLIGKAGQISIGGAAFMGVGAYTTALTRGTPFHYFPIPLLLSMIVGAILGVVVALPALRISGIYLVLTTLAFQEIFSFWAQSYQGIRAGFYPPEMKLFGANLNTSRWLFVVAVVCLFLVLVVLRNLYRHAPGNMWRAIREDPMASGVIGINVEKWRLLAFVGSSAVTALAGSLFAYLIGLVAFSTFTLTLGISLVVMVYLGGIGSPVGVFIGAAAITFLPNGLQDLANLAPAGSSFSSWLISNQGTDESLVYGTVLIVILLFEPAGLAGIGRNVAGRVVRRVRRIRRAPAEELSNVVKEDSADATPVSGAVAPEVAIVTDQEVLSQRATNAILKMTDVTVTYRNGAQGIHEVNLVIEPSTIVAIVGRNGAGKSSTLQAIAGFLPAERVRVRGSVKWKGQEIIRSSPRKTGRAGVILVPERFKVFPSLTVQEHFKADGISSQREKECLEQFTVLQGFLKTKGGLLSGGERQLLGIVLAVARRPELLMVDELSLGLSPIATQSMLAELKRVRDEEGIAILLVDQAASAISHVVDYYYLLDGGSVVGEGSAEHVTEQQIRAAVMGE